ncbi:MAG: hypothetical protein NZ942_03935 [Candidatus Aenigmarchaeota archaeon]|nr:hypothetical protein [Candidatus Aenigmarchaeota archaeon]
MKENHFNNYHKWYKWAYEQRYGNGSWEKDKGVGVKEEVRIPFDFRPYEPDVKRYWSEEKAIGVMERNGKFIGIACLAAKEVVDKESFVKRFGLSFEKDVQWHAISSLLDHLSRSPMFKAVLITASDVPFKLEPDIPEDLKGRINWVKRNYEYHKEKAESLKKQIERQSGSFGGVIPIYLPKQMKEEQDHARYFLEQLKSLENRMQEHLKQYFTIKENLFATALFFYVYTSEKGSFEEVVREIENRKYSAKMEIVKTYFVKCSDVKDPLIVFNPEFFPYFEEVKKYYCLALAQDCAGFSSDKDVAIALKHMFTSVLELPKEEEIEEQIHIPSEEVSIPRERSAFIGYVVESVVKRKIKNKILGFHRRFKT